jgi:hypothetical protein
MDGTADYFSKEYIEASSPKGAAGNSIGVASSTLRKHQPVDEPGQVGAKLKTDDCY